MKYLIILIMLTAITGCKGQAAPSVSMQDETHPYTFQMTTIPSTILVPEERAAYLVAHYWDHFDFADTTFMQKETIIEQAFVDYIDVFPYTTQPVVSASIRSMLKKSEQQLMMFDWFAGLYEKYLYDPNSPMRNDEYYIPFLETLIDSPMPGNKARYKLLLGLAAKNRVGNPAADFSYTTAKGLSGSLYSLRSTYTLIFFYNPDCRTCRDISTQLQSSPAVSSLTSSGRLTILAIYTDNDTATWRRYLPQMPATWIVAHDHEQRINSDELYDLKAIPSIYLLDETKKVLLKDATFEILEQYLSGRQ